MRGRASIIIRVRVLNSVRDFVGVTGFPVTVVMLVVVFSSVCVQLCVCSAQCVFSSVCVHLCLYM